MKMVKKIYDLGKIPLHLGLSNKPTNPSGIPNAYEFTIGCDLDFGLITQMPKKKTVNLLKDIYKKGSLLGNPMCEKGLGRDYLDDFFCFIKSIYGNLKNKKVLEIGCGKGTLLRKIYAEGAEVVGLEPGKQNVDGAISKKINIVTDFYPSASITERFDLIIHYGVLEHVQDYRHFLTAHRNNLRPDGMALFSVPNCSSYLKNGDISIFFHEHWNYFNFYSIERLLQGISFKIVDIAEGKIGDTLYLACCCKDAEPIPTIGQVKKEMDDDLYNKFSNSISKIKGWFNKYKRNNETIGIYCPGRFINYLYKMSDCSNVRFFDDENNFHAKYYPPFNIKVDNFNELVQRPVSKLIIASRFFGERIRKRVTSAQIMKSEDIFLMEDILKS